jgi:hypothetical protein
MQKSIAFYVSKIIVRLFPPEDDSANFLQANLVAAESWMSPGDWPWYSLSAKSSQFTEMEKP